MFPLFNLFHLCGTSKVSCIKDKHFLMNIFLLLIPIYHFQHSVIARKCIKNKVKRLVHNIYFITAEAVCVVLSLETKMGKITSIWIFPSLTESLKKTEKRNFFINRRSSVAVWKKLIKIKECLMNTWSNMISVRDEMKTGVDKKR